MFYNTLISKEELLGTRYHGSKGVSVDFMQNLLAFLHCCLHNKKKTQLYNHLAGSMY